eukprot:TRINITY_DN14347_c2_g2_i2.p1 TRINITY_DN14347_c2_g2~~TRINITY_DN14347_c2_g2_i2.p1  ORF type:complete len:326 (-),score=79.79 TRINITY_DN14347_c2_g2_i2:105-1082(-)
MALEEVPFGDAPGANGVPSAPNGRHDDESTRPPRLPRWTRQEILVLIQGKKVAEGRVRRRRGDGSVQSEPKWASVAAYCRRHGVSRGPVQCRKRWSNLAGDFKKIREWEMKKSGESDSFWVMRSDVRRERRLPGFFDREVYDVLDREEAKKSGGEAVVMVEEEEEDDEEVIFDSGRAAAAEEGLFSDCEQSGQEEGKGSAEEEVAAIGESPVGVAAPTPISEKLCLGYLDEGMANEKQPTVDLKKGTSQDGEKRRRVSLDGSGVSNLQDQLIEVLEQNSRMLIAQIEAQNTNCQLDRDQRKDHSDSLVGVLGKLADALDRIADKL